MKGYNKLVCIAIVLIMNLLILPFESYGNTASSAIVMEVKTGRVLYSKNINSKKPMASTTKIMTALLALENGNIKDKVKVSPDAVGVEGSSIYLQYDEVISLEDLVYGLMLRSGNDSASAIAYHVAGSEEKFASLMTKKAKDIGANNTNFTNPHGLHNTDHYTTAYDLALITREALLNDKFKEIVKTKKWVSNRTTLNKVFYNKNKTLFQFPGGDGVKTGYTTVAGRCLVTSATRDDMQIIAVVLNDYNWFDDCYNLMESTFEKYKPYQALKKNEAVKSITVENGKKKKSYLVPEEDIIIPVSDEEKSRVHTIIEAKETCKAPITRGKVYGRAKVYIEDKLISTTNLIAREDIEENRFIDHILDFFK